MRSERLAARKRNNRLLTFWTAILTGSILIPAAVVLAVPAGTAQHNVVACYNSAGVLERVVVNGPVVCAHPWDKKVTWNVSDLSSPPPPTVPSTTVVIAPNTTTTKVVSTTTVGTSPSTTTIPIGPNSPPISGGFFQLTASGTPFKTDAQCSALVHHSTWEPRPENNTANHTAPVHPELLANFSQWTTAWNVNYKPRIDGNFSGTTDEIIQWAACKWGWSDDVIRAEAITESSWRQSTAGDGGNSFGLLQIKWNFHPAGPAKGAVGSSWPNSANSTAYAVDQQVAEMRGCYDGMSTYLGATTGDLWGCLQSWFSGSWTAGGGSYANGVKSHYTNKDWLKSGF